MNTSTVTFKGTPVRLAGEFVKEQTVAPDFKLVRGDLSACSLQEFKGKWVVLSIFPSLDTGVCATTVRKFNRMVANMTDVVMLAISRDLPFAQSRFCSIENIEHVSALSDFRPGSTFGSDYGVLMTEGPLAGLFARAAVVINPQGRVVHAQLVPEVTQEPDYEKILSFISS